MVKGLEEFLKTYGKEGWKKEKGWQKVSEVIVDMKQNGRNEES